MLRILIYGDINLNIIDGSSIWLTSMCRIVEGMSLCRADLLLKCPPKTSGLFDEISNIANLELISASDTNAAGNLTSKYRLKPDDAIECISAMHQKNNYHLIIVRGFELVKRIVATDFANIVIPYVTDFSHDAEQFSQQSKTEFLKIYHSVNHMFVQTEATSDYLKKVLDVDGKKFRTLLPMVPDISAGNPPFTIQNYSTAYIGKFAKDWHTEEIIKATQALAERMNYITLNVAGSKFQQNIRDKQAWITEQLNHHPNIHWFGGVSRTKAQEIIRQSDIGISWRSAEIDNDNSLELSTKLLEYGCAGKPVILRRTKIHEDLLGTDYEAFVNNQEQYIEKVTCLLNDPEMYRRCAVHLYERCQTYTFSARRQALAPLFRSYGPKKLKLLFAGHDLKFLKHAISYFDNHQSFTIQIDQWQGHEKHDETNSERLLKWADIIFCEWGLGNTVWYSNRKKPGQKLIVRMHGQERLTSYPLQFNVENIDKIITVSPYMYELLHKSFGLPRHKFKIISNMVETEALNLPKDDKDIQFNLGIAGILPKLKRPDQAIKILEKLYLQDKRYKLFIKSRRPEDLSWLMNRPAERQYYEKFEEMIRSSPARDHIIFDPHGNDMAEWFQKIGYVLSTSEFESFHLTPLEGMASGAVPIILDWPGSRAVHDQRFVFEDVEEASKFIQSKESRSLISSESLKQYVTKTCSLNFVIGQIQNLLIE